ncbi:hypothetical protein JXA12_00445 [Candidatus Woesearchaeota archaeon]|nr:hypothetical protein [Candidatus Woesearchaeota archaeon]
MNHDEFQHKILDKPEAQQKKTYRVHADTHYGVVCGMMPADYNERRSDTHPVSASSLEEACINGYERAISFGVGWLPQTEGHIGIVITGLDDGKTIIDLEEMARILEPKARQTTNVQEYKSSKGILYRHDLLQEFMRREKGLRRAIWND